MPQSYSPFLEIPESQWLAENEHAFAIYDGFPVSPGHSLVVTKRVVPTWFDASSDEQASMMALVNDVRTLLLENLTPVPVAFNVGFNAGIAAGQTVPHVHIHVIPRYPGDVPDPRGGVRHVIPGKGNYLTDPSLALASG
jgi:diadenosine tetraphosphate (Ap4A) HIT family hydrolase